MKRLLSSPCANAYLRQRGPGGGCERSRGRKHKHHQQGCQHPTRARRRAQERRMATRQMTERVRSVARDWSATTYPNKKKTIAPVQQSSMFLSSTFITFFVRTDLPVRRPGWEGKTRLSERSGSYEQPVSPPHTSSG